MAINPSPWSASDLWTDICAVRERAPLVHNITNMVVMNFNANVLLAAGASPVMAHAHEELEDMVNIANSLVLNIGTLDAAWLQSMHRALAQAQRRSIPVVLDPVGAGATRYRTAAVRALLAAGGVRVVRGNASEIMASAQQVGQTRGVDSSAQGQEALPAARALAQEIGGVVCVSGAIDHVVDAQGRHAQLRNGHAWMTRITGTGCSATALVGALSAVQADAWRATTAAMAWLGVAGECAAERAQAAGAGVGSMAPLLLDALQGLDADSFAQRLRLHTA